MPTELLLMRNGNHLSPVEQWGQEYIESMKAGEIVLVKLSRSRNLKHHAKFFVLISEIFKNQERYPTADHLLDAIKIGIGHYDTYWLTKTRQVVQPRSISFAKMNQESFEQFYNKVIVYVLDKILPSVDRQDLENRVHEILGGTA